MQRSEKAAYDQLAAAFESANGASLDAYLDDVFGEDRETTSGSGGDTGGSGGASGSSTDDDDGTSGGSGGGEDDEDGEDEDGDGEDGEEGDDEEGDDEEGDGEEGDDEEGEETTEATSDTESEDESEGDGGDEGTPTPDAVPIDPAARNDFLASPVGASTMDRHEEAIRMGQGGGLIDVEPPADMTSWYESDLSASERRLVGDAVEMATSGGHTDPPEHDEFTSGAGSPVDELKLAGGGVIDPIDPSPGRFPIDNPIVGPPPIDPGGSGRTPGLDDGKLDGLGDDLDGDDDAFAGSTFELQLNEGVADAIDSGALDDLTD
jgi:segregation and condensation protein B